MVPPFPVSRLLSVSRNIPAMIPITTELFTMPPDTHIWWITFLALLSTYCPSANGRPSICIGSWSTGFISNFLFRLMSSSQHVFFHPLTVLYFISKPCFVLKCHKWGQRNKWTSHMLIRLMDTNRQHVPISMTSPIWQATPFHRMSKMLWTTFSQMTADLKNCKNHPNKN